MPLEVTLNIASSGFRSGLHVWGEVKSQNPALFQERFNFRDVMD